MMKHAWRLRDSVKSRLTRLRRFSDIKDRRLQWLTWLQPRSAGLRHLIPPRAAPP
jgi:hypothetical protein